MVIGRKCRPWSRACLRNHGTWSDTRRTGFANFSLFSSWRVPAQSQPTEIDSGRRLRKRHLIFDAGCNHRRDVDRWALGLGNVAKKAYSLRNMLAIGGEPVLAAPASFPQTSLEPCGRPFPTRALGRRGTMSLASSIWVRDGRRGRE